jgi:hypothetical protein
MACADAPQIENATRPLSDDHDGLLFESRLIRLTAGPPVVGTTWIINNDSRRRVARASASATVV